MDPGRILVGVLVLIVAVIMMTTVTWEVKEVETYYTHEPYSFEQSLVRESQVRKFLFFEVTQAQYIVKNTDLVSGMFVLNYIFDNGEKTETETKTVEILAGEEMAVTVDSPLLMGKSSVTLNVIPPNKSIPKERIVTKEVSVLDYIGLGWLKFFFR